VLPSVDDAITVDKSKKLLKRLCSSNVPPALISVAEESAIIDIHDPGLLPPHQTVSDSRAEAIPSAGMYISVAGVGVH